MKNSFKIGDSFPPEKKKQSVDVDIKRGLIIYSYFYDIDAKHDKYFILISIHIGNIFGFFINSEPPSLAEKNEEIKKMQIIIRKDDYAFLSKPVSYINWTNYYKQPFQDFYNMLLESPSKICGQLNEIHLKQIDNAIKNSKIYSPKQISILLNEFDF